jgi:hypothetical protein
MGGSSKSRSTSLTTTPSNSTTTPTLPDWASGVIEQTAGRIGGLLDQDPNTAPANPLQAQAAQGAAALNSGPEDLGWAQDRTKAAGDTSWLNPYMNADTPFASGGKAYNYVDRYLNPYLHEVVDASAADFDANAGQVRAQQALDLAGAGAFGGSGAALTQSMTEGELARARATALSGLRSQAYDTALSAAGGDADRATQARIANAQTALQDRAQKVGWGLQGRDQALKSSDQLVGLRGAYNADARANIGLQNDVGGTSVAQAVALLSGLPLGLVAGHSTSTTTTEAGNTRSKSTPSPAEILAKAFAAGA